MRWLDVHSDQLVPLQRRHDLVQLLELKAHPARQVVVLQTIADESSQAAENVGTRENAANLPLSVL